MRDVPSSDLTRLLERLGIRSPAHVRALGKRVRKLAGGLPQFDSIWVDALAQARLITAYQAREISAGRGDTLWVGPYLVCSRVSSIGYADLFLAREVSQAVPHRNKSKAGPILLMRAKVDSSRRSEIQERLATLVEVSQGVDSSRLGLLHAAGADGDVVWGAAKHRPGVRATDWIVENGRFPPLVVLNIARQMLVDLCQLERRRLWHGDLHPRNLVLCRDGSLVLIGTGLRTILRPQEGLSMVDQPPESYESLASERVLQGTPSTAASELFACGCLWWQLLTGRPALPGANGLAKVKAVAEGRIPDVRQIAPDAPPILAEIIAACTSANPADRPASFVEVAQILGPPGEQGAKAIVRCLKRPERWLLPRSRPKRKRRRLALHGLEIATAAACIFVMLGAWRMLVRPAATKVPTVASSIKSPIERPAVKPAKAAPVIPVLPASYQEAAKPHRKAKPADPVPLRLPTDRMLRLSTLTPSAGQLVCGERDGRPTVIVPAGGLLIEQPGVCFRNVDFLTDSDDASSALVVLRTTGASFERCTFHGSSTGGPQRSAISWEPIVSPIEDDWDAETDRLSLVNCVMHRVGIAIDRSRDREATIECNNVLQVGAGSLTRVASPMANATVVILLDHCTLRESGPVLEQTASTPSSGRRGRILITAVDCVFAPGANRAVIEIAPDVESVDLSRLRWNGRDSLIETSAVLLANRDKSGAIESADDSRLDLVGLVRSKLEFADETLDAPTASYLRRWVAPRQSLDPPGITPLDLPEITPHLTTVPHELRLK